MPWYRLSVRLYPVKEFGTTVIGLSILFLSKQSLLLYSNAVFPILPFRGKQWKSNEENKISSTDDNEIVQYRARSYVQYTIEKQSTYKVCTEYMFVCQQETEMKKGFRANSTAVYGVESKNALPFATGSLAFLCSWLVQKQILRYKCVRW